MYKFVYVRLGTSRQWPVGTTATISNSLVLISRDKADTVQGTICHTPYHGRYWLVKKEEEDCVCVLIKFYSCKVLAIYQD